MEIMMHTTTARIFILLLIMVLAGCNQSTPPPAVTPATPGVRYDHVIRNGQVFDGSGAPAQELDVAIKDERIAALLPRGTKVDTYNEIDAKGVPSHQASSTY